MKHYHEAKQRLFTDLMWKSQKSPTTAIINIDDSFGRRTRVSEKAGILTYGQTDCDFQFKVQNFDWMGTRFELKTIEENFEIQIPLLGVHNVYNTVAALAVASALGVKIEPLIPILQSFKGIPGRLQKVPVQDKQVFIDYAHTPDALEKVLQMLHQTRKSIQKKSQIWCVFGCGGDRDAGKRPLMAMAAEKYSDQVIVTSDNPRTENPGQILNDIEKGFSKAKYKKIENRKEAIHYALQNSAIDDVILIAGKGHEDYQIIGTEKTHFSDYEVVIEGVKP
jgi:UDP-N-acetylmuramoyl-L-alanyl-D-glutamate--2,6-diaminopimelate ligase